MKHPRTRAGGELLATLTDTNVQASQEPRDRGIGGPEILFAAGFVAVVAGLALVWLPLGLVFLGAMLTLAAWKLA